MILTREMTKLFNFLISLYRTVKERKLSTQSTKTNQTHKIKTFQKLMKNSY